MIECRCKLPPEVTFERREDGAMLFAEPPGARIVIRWMGEDRASVAIADRRKSDLAEVPSEPIANFEAQLRLKSESIQQEATELACAVYWSWWRALLIKGEAPMEKAPLISKEEYAQLKAELKKTEFPTREEQEPWFVTPEEHLQHEMQVEAERVEMDKDEPESAE